MFKCILKHVCIDVLTLFFLVSLCFATHQNITNQDEILTYLQRFGYINKSENAFTDITGALVDFQRNLQSSS